MGARVLKKEGVCSDTASYLPVTPVYLTIIHVKYAFALMRVSNQYRSLPVLLRNSEVTVTLVIIVIYVSVRYDLRYVLYP